MAVSLSTTTSAGLSRSHERTIVKTSIDTLVLFEIVSNHVQYKKSTDAGATWDVAWTDVFGTRTSNHFTTYIEVNNDIYIIVYCYTGSTYQTYFQKLTYTGVDTWNIETPVQIAATNVNFPSFCKRSNGDFWVSGFAGDKLKTYYSTDSGASWNAVSQLDVGTAAYASCIIPYGANLWQFVIADADLRVYEYISSWSLLATVDNNGMTNDYECLGVIKISDSDIWAAGRTASGIKVFHWTGSWDSGELLSNHANDQSPCLSYIGNSLPVCSWVDYDGTNYNIAYRAYTGAAWDTVVNVTSDVAKDWYLTAAEYYSGALYLHWRTGASSPYTVYFASYSFAVTNQTTINSDAKVQIVDIQTTIDSDAYVVSRIQTTINSDSKVKVLDKQTTVNSDAKVKVLDKQVTITSDAEVTGHSRKYIDSDAKVKVLDKQTIINSDAKIKIIDIQTTITSNAIVSVEAQTTITSNAYVLAPHFVDLDNKISVVKQPLTDINNKISVVKRVLKDINNVINFVRSTLVNINNDFRCKKEIITDITNDIRFYKTWQMPNVNFGFQSKGKAYINVYIGGVLQTDVDVDSISISKVLSAIHTASFTLGRAYDAAKPTIDQTILIKYDDWTLYMGYVTSILPSDDPDSVVINCQDEYYYQNTTQQSFFVGHSPKGLQHDTYYSTIAEALTAVFSWTPGFGNFVPEIMDCFEQGQCDILSKLIRESGNNEWYYNDGIKEPWSSGAGRIIDLHVQELGKNIELFDVINHRFTESVDGLVNRFRVNMGSRSIKTIVKQKVFIDHAVISGFVSPAWNSNYEHLAKNSPTGYGWDYHKPSDSDLYKDVFVKYDLEQVIWGWEDDTDTWDDEYEPYIEIWDDFIYGWSRTVLTEGFSIDYKNKLLILNEPRYFYQVDSNGEWTGLKAPNIFVQVNKIRRREYTYNTGGGTTNPYVFYTPVMGSYGKTITETINLGHLTPGSQRTNEPYSTYTSYNFVDARGHIIYGWNDTEYALDFANWQLSKKCDKKLRGEIEITIDTLCWYNIKLHNRIRLSGINSETYNITNISLDLGRFVARLTLENSRYYQRTVSLPARREQ